MLFTSDQCSGLRAEPWKTDARLAAYDAVKISLDEVAHVIITDPSTLVAVLKTIFEASPLKVEHDLILRRKRPNGSRVQGTERAEG